MNPGKIFNSIKLPTLSKTLFDIVELEKLNKPSYISDFRKIVEKDPLLSAQILRISNSSAYGFAGQVRSIPHAISLLGVKKIRNIAFRFSVSDFLKKVSYRPEFSITFNSILKKSLLISAISTIIGQKTDYIDPDELYIAGLMSKIGQLILFLYDPETYSTIYEIDDKTVIPVEQYTFKTDHITLGQHFSEKWMLPAFMSEAVSNHVELKSSSSRNKIFYIANKLANLLLLPIKMNSAHPEILKQLDSDSEKLLGITLSELEHTIESLPEVIQTYIGDFPEVQNDIKKVVDSGTEIILSLMKKEMDMVILTRELSDSQKKLTKEKDFLSHMLHISSLFSSLMPPDNIISTLYEYFDSFISGFSIRFVYYSASPHGQVTYKYRGNRKLFTLNNSDFPGFSKAIKSDEIVPLTPEEIKHLKYIKATNAYIFPVLYHKKLFGFLLLFSENQSYIESDPEVYYLRILSNIVANAFQNYYSLQTLKKEINKKEMVTKELFNYNEKLNHSRQNLLQLQKSEVFGEILPVIFHKLKNKLTPILGYAQILNSKTEDEGIKRRLSKIEVNADDLTNLLNILRNYFKNEHTSFEKENINNILKLLNPFFESIKEKGSIDISMKHDYTIPDDMINSGQIQCLIVNLIENSVDSILRRNIEKGSIKIITENNSDHYKLIVEDNGIGIPEENLIHIWTPFYTSKPERAGIGLSICEKILKNHNCKWNVASNPEEFTRFEIIFSSEHEDERFIEVEETGPANHSLGAKIMIVDDEEYLLDLMKEILMKDFQFKIFSCVNGKEAINVIEKNQIDLVISDVRMPELNGIELFKYLESKGMEDRVIMVTADPYSADVAHFLSSTNLPYLKKPFELMQFKQMVIEKLSNGGKNV